MGNPHHKNKLISSHNPLISLQLLPFSSTTRGRTVAGVVVLEFSSVEVPVATAGRTLKCPAASIFSACHELSTTINSKSSYVGCMVLLALPISHTPPPYRGRTTIGSLRLFPSFGSLLVFLHSEKLKFDLLADYLSRIGCRVLQSRQTNYLSWSISNTNPNPNLQIYSICNLY